MIFLALKTEDGRTTGKISFYCRMLEISRQGFYKYLANQDRPWKYPDLAVAKNKITREEQCKESYGQTRMKQEKKYLPDFAGQENRGYNDRKKDTLLYIILCASPVAICSR